MGCFTTSRVFAFGALLFVLATHPAKGQLAEEWTWKDSDGKSHSRAELESIVRKHKQWMESNHKLGSRAELRGADLRDAELTQWDLGFVDLRGANLSHAQLRGANLDEARLGSANLSSADLGGAKLNYTELISADLNGADVSKAILRSAYLNSAVLDSADLSQAVLVNADLEGAHLSQTNLRDADLTGADLHDADLNRTIFEAKSLPDLRGIAGATSLELLTYGENPDALVQLRKQFEDGGFRDQERKITYALKRKEAELSWEGCRSRKAGDETRAILWSSDSNLANCGSFLLNRVFFDWTCQYGMSPGRPLSLGVLVWAFCSILYFVSIRASGEAGLYRVYAQSIQDDPSGQKRVEKIAPPAITQAGSVRRFFQFFWREWMVLRASMFFSLMSAFNIGFRDINFGRWLRLLTRQEFDIKAVGWARVVAGWQSLISVYFIALWVLTYFGRPFG